MNRGNISEKAGGEKEEIPVFLDDGKNYTDEQGEGFTGG